MPFGRCGGTQEAGNTIAVSLAVLYRVDIHQIRQRRRAARSSTGEGRAEPLCARIKGADREISEGKYDADYSLFSSCKDHKERRTGKIQGAFSRMHSALNGWMLARTPASPPQGLHHHRRRYFTFPYFCTMCGLEKLGFVDQNWLERNLSALLLGTLAGGRRQQSESIEVALDIE